MAKAKRGRSEGQEKTLTKKQIARSKKVARQERTVWLGVGGVVALVLIVLTIGIVQEYVLSPRQPVAIVNGEEISREDYQKSVRYTQWSLQRREQNLVLEQAVYDPEDESQQFLYQYLGDQIEQVREQQLSAPTQTLEVLIDEGLVRQEAARRGLTVSSEEIELAVEQQFGYDRNPPAPTPTPITTTTALTPTIPTTPVAPMTREEFDEGYSEFIQTMGSAVKGFSEEYLNQMIEQNLLREKLAESLADEVPTADEHVHAYHIVVETEEVAAEVLEKLKAGDNFADLAAEYSQGEDTVEMGGELGWLAMGQAGVSAALVEAAFALQPGEFSEPIETYEGYHIVTIDERQSDRPLDETTLDSRKGQAFGNWLTGAREAATIERTWSPEDVPAD